MRIFFFLLFTRPCISSNCDYKRVKKLAFHFYMPLTKKRGAGKACKNLKIMKIYANKTKRESR